MITLIINIFLLTSKRLRKIDRRKKIDFQDYKIHRKIIIEKLKETDIFR